MEKKDCNILDQKDYDRNDDDEQLVLNVRQVLYQAWNSSGIKAVLYATFAMKKHSLARMQWTATNPNIRPSKTWSKDRS